MANNECICGNPAEIRQERRIINILGEEHAITETYCHCPQCGEEWVTPAQCKAATGQIDAIKRRIMGHLAPADIAALRHRHHLTQQQAARLFGSDEKAFSRYERGEAYPSAAMDKLLRLYDSSESAREAIRALAETA